MAARSPLHDRSARLRRAFTLLEVLAAVAILALLYTVLADVAIQAMRAEGDASRRLDASLLADRVLSEIEAQMDLGEGRPESSETEEDDFRITVDVVPYALVLPEDPAQRERRVAPRPSLLQASGPGRPSALLEVRVHVAWTEGVSERVVSRTTWGIDREVAGRILSSSAPNLLETGPREGSADQAPEELVQ